MDIKKIAKESFCVIGKLGSTDDGDNFIGRLWADANANFGDIAHLVKVDENGSPVGFWGAMSDTAMTFAPWEDCFSKGLYLAGAEVNDDAIPPKGWTKWTVPSYEYLRIKVEDDAGDTFPSALKYMDENGYQLAGAVHDFINPAENGQMYMFFPVRKL
jgi:Bacterial transcription activator, effector binding domain.